MLEHLGSGGRLWTIERMLIIEGLIELGLLGV